jgi:hypothetical protein
MKKHYGNHIGVVIGSNDPEHRGRVQVFVPHVLPTLYESWNKNPENGNIQINCPGSDINGLSDDIIDRLRQILPWAEAASPIIGQTAPGNASGGLASKVQEAIQGATDAVKKTFNKLTGNTEDSSNPVRINQSPTAAPAGKWTPGIKLKIPNIGGADTNNLLPGFIARLNAFYEEASSLGYTVQVTSAYRAGSQGMHSQGLAADIDFKGNGVSITPKALENALKMGYPTQGAFDIKNNYDTQAFRDLLKKHGLHQPLHTIHNASNPEKWHIEPVELPVAGGRTQQGLYNGVQLCKQRLGSPTPPIAEQSNSSGVPPLKTPHSSPEGADLTSSSSGPSNPGTAKTEKERQQDQSGPININSKSTEGNVQPLGTKPALSTPSGSVATAESIKPPTNSNSSGDNGVSLLAKMRTKRFGAEARNEHVLGRIEYIMGYMEASVSDPYHASLVFETLVNRAYFSEESLTFAVFFSRYLSAVVHNHDTETVRKPTSFAKTLVDRVIFGGQNYTGMMTDNCSNVPNNPLARKCIGDGTRVTGSFWKKGKQITNPTETAHCAVTNSGAEFLCRKDLSMHPIMAKKSTSPAKHEEILDGSRHCATYGALARQFALAYNAGNPAPVFDAFKTLPEDLQKALHEKAVANKENLLNIPTSKVTPPTSVHTLDEHGPTMHKNTNDMPKGMFTFPREGAMVWVFFREGNPLFPVYFAASYSAAEWEAAYRGSSINSLGTNAGSIDTQTSSSTSFAPNAGGGLEFTHIIDNSDPSGVNNKNIAMMYGDDGSNMTFTRGFHQIYTRHDRRDQVDGQRFSIVGGNEEHWVDQDSNTNIKGSSYIKVGKLDSEALTCIEELAAFSRELNEEYTKDPEKDNS